jgi:hypothetical protein
MLLEKSAAPPLGLPSINAFAATAGRCVRCTASGNSVEESEPWWSRSMASTRSPLGRSKARLAAIVVCRRLLQIGDQQNGNAVLESLVIVLRLFNHWPSEPVRSPDLNAYSERWIRSVKEECLSKLLLIGGRSLPLALSEYVARYHAERNHQGKDNVLLFPRDTQTQRGGPVQSRERLGGALSSSRSRVTWRKSLG